MFLFSWYFDFLCKFKIFNEPWSLDKMSFLLNLAYFFSCKIKDWNLKLAYASQFMQNMVVGSFIENIKTKIFIKFHFINFMTYLARVANSMVIFSASYQVFWWHKSIYYESWTTSPPNPILLKDESLWSSQCLYNRLFLHAYNNIIILSS